MTTGSGIADRYQAQPAKRKIAEFEGQEFSERATDRSRRLAIDKIQNFECEPGPCFPEAHPVRMSLPGAQGLVALEFFTQ
ncbi:MAG TPA: hypothetical protein VK937_16975 [Candidatus Limnocylindria bacterium]|nr:hypothetical protein [Candidatus Limnocylindria bacterium]